MIRADSSQIPSSSQTAVRPEAHHCSPVSPRAGCTHIASIAPVAFEYLSNFWVESSGGTAKAAFTDDTDTVLYSEHLLELGLVMKLRQAKGLPWATDMDTFEREKERLMGQEMPLETLGDRSLNNFVINVPQTGFGS